MQTDINSNRHDTTISLQNGRISLAIPIDAMKPGMNISIAHSDAHFIDTGILLHQFQLLPEGTKFKKPVTLILHYDETWLKGNLPYNIGVAFRYDKTGQWYAPINGKVDTVKHTISVPITHFSHWSIYSSFHLEMQYEDQISTDNAITITMPTGKTAQLRCFMDAPPSTLKKENVDNGDIDLIAPLVIDPVTQSDDIDKTGCKDCDLLAPLTPINPQDKDKHVLEPDKWYVNGVNNGNSTTGTISRSGKSFVYHAPEKVPNQNPVSIRAAFRALNHGKTYLVQNVHITGGRRWKITVTTINTFKDESTYDRTTTTQASFFIHCDGKTYSTDIHSIQLLYLDSVQYETPVDHFTIHEKNRTCNVSYKKPLYQYQSGLIGGYDGNKNTFNPIALQLATVDNAESFTNCIDGNCNTETNPPYGPTGIDLESLSAADGYSKTYQNETDAYQTIISKLVVTKIK